MKTSSVFVALFVFTCVGLFGDYLINENIQNWTSRTTTGNYTQAIQAGTVLLTQCRVYPTFSGNGAGSNGYVQLYSSSTIEFPFITSAGRIELVVGSSTPLAASLQYKVGSDWLDFKRLVSQDPAVLTTLNLNNNQPTQLRITNFSGTMRLYDIRVHDFAPPQSPVANTGQNITSESFTASWSESQGATSYQLNVYQKSPGTQYTLQDLEGYDDDFPPTGWAYGGSDLIRIGTTGSHSGYYYAYIGSSSSWIRTPQLNGSDHIRFWVKAYAATSSFTLRLQSSVNLSTWTDVATWSANGSNTGDITTDYRQLESTIDISEPFYLRLTLASVGGPCYIDDIEIGYPAQLPQYHLDSMDVGDIMSYQVTGLMPETMYYYTVRATGNGVTGYESNEVMVQTLGLPEYDFPTDVPVVIEDITVTFTSGYANLGPGVPGLPPNPEFVPIFGRIIDLQGAGPWSISFSAPSDVYAWVAYRHGLQWRAMANEAGLVVINIDATKDNLLEIQAGSGANPTLPVVLTSFTANLNPNNHIALHWVTQSETNALGYYVYRGTGVQLDGALQVSGLIGATNTSQQQVYCHTDTEILTDGTYWYWLESRDLDGGYSIHGPVSMLVNHADPEAAVIPLKTGLGSPFPNPFNPVVLIPYQLAREGIVRIGIYNLRGQLIRAHNFGNTQPGSYSLEWDGRDGSGRSCSSGIYQIVMEAGGERHVGKVVLAK